MTRVCGQLGQGEQNLRSDRLSPGPSLGLLTLQAGGVAIDQEADQGILFIHSKHISKLHLRKSGKCSQDLKGI